VAGGGLSQLQAIRAQGCDDCSKRYIVTPLAKRMPRASRLSDCRKSRETCAVLCMLCLPAAYMSLLYDLKDNTERQSLAAAAKCCACAVIGLTRATH